MSTNIHILANREIQVLSTGQITQQKEFCKMVWQTPTCDTYEIMESTDPVASYCDWVRGLGQMNAVSQQEHISAITRWVSNMQAQGYSIEVEAW